jgi:3-hydroxyisobutyrate dehydrogenase-like beta-hydroxyacid dehydrogenase
MGTDGTATQTIGLLHPGEMGAAIGGDLRRRGHRVLWASEGRSAASAERARGAGLEDAGGLEELTVETEVILSICPPSVALATAEAVAARGFEGVYADCNAVAPRTAARILDAVEAAGARAVDGGIVGMPPGEASSPHLYLSGAAAADVASLFAGGRVDARVLGGAPTDASALKMLYAAWTKGSAALLLAIDSGAEAAGLAAELRQEWSESQPGLAERLEAARRSSEAKGWRWVGEMEEIAIALADLGEPAGFHEAAAAVFERSPKPAR